jgi:hypothetical protein
LNKECSYIDSHQKGDCQQAKATKSEKHPHTLHVEK